MERDKSGEVGWRVRRVEEEAGKDIKEGGIEGNKPAASGAKSPGAAEE